jgi:drug/metabolite transporter (DMT)-like permease
MARLFLLLLVGISAASTASIFIKLCEAPALIIAAYRMVFASLMLLPFACRQKVWKDWSKSGIGWLALSGVFLSLHFAFWIGSLKYTSVASSVVLVSTHPIFVGIGSWLFLKEHLGINLILGIGLSVLGSGLISFGDMAVSGEALAGDGLALLGAVAVSGYFLVGRKMRRGQNLLSYIFPVYSTAGVVLVILAYFFRDPFFGYKASNYFLFFLLALIPQLVGHTSFNWALKYIPASLVAITVLGEPVGSTILAYFILDEGLNLWKVFGGLTIFMGILVALWRGTPDSNQPISKNTL